MVIKTNNNNLSTNDGAVILAILKFAQENISPKNIIKQSGFIAYITGNILKRDLKIGISSRLNPKRLRLKKHINNCCQILFDAELIIIDNNSGFKLSPQGVVVLGNIENGYEIFINYGDKYISYIITKTAQHKNNKYYDEGFDAYSDGDNHKANPYNNIDQYDAWQTGWVEALNHASK